MSLLLFEQILNGIQFGVMLFLIASGLTLIFGVMGVINLSHGSLYMIGAFACAYVIGKGGHFIVGLISGSLAAACMGILIEIFVIRRLYKRDHLDQVLATFALILIISEGTLYIFGTSPLWLDVPESLATSINLGGLVYPLYRLVIIITGLIICIGLYIVITRTRIGMQIRAGANDREMISALGVNISFLYTFIFSAGAALAGLAGSMIGALQSVQVGMGEPMLILAFVVIVIGGIGSVKGAFIGSLLVGIVDTLGRSFLPYVFRLFMETSSATVVGSALASMLIYLVMILVLAYKPRGLFPANN